MRDDAKFHDPTLTHPTGSGDGFRPGSSGNPGIWKDGVSIGPGRRSAADAFDEDAKPSSLEDDRDLEAADDSEKKLFDDDLGDAGEDDINLVVAVYQEDGRATAVPMDFSLANDLDELIRQFGRLLDDSGADGYVSVASEFLVVYRVRGRVVEVLLSDATAANDWPIARDVMDYLGEEIPDEGDGPTPIGDLEMFTAAGLRGFELEAIVTDYEEDSDELLMQMTRRLKIDEMFERAVEAFDD